MNQGTQNWSSLRQLGYYLYQILAEQIAQYKSEFQEYSEQKGIKDPFRTTTCIFYIYADGDILLSNGVTILGDRTGKNMMFKYMEDPENWGYPPIFELRTNKGSVYYLRLELPGKENIQGSCFWKSEGKGINPLKGEDILKSPEAQNAISMLVQAIAL